MCEVHAQEAKGEGAVESEGLDHFMVSEFIKMKEDLAEKQVARGETLSSAKGKETSKEGATKSKRTMKSEGTSVREEGRLRTVQGNLFCQLAIAFMNRSDHYHHAELIDVKTHQAWMPAFQGVRKVTQLRA